MKSLWVEIIKEVLYTFAICTPIILLGLYLFWRW